MCELFGVSAAKRLQVNDMLKEFYSHSVCHPHGWGLAIFHENSASIEKEPVEAAGSAYLKERLRHKITVRAMIAHIRLATVGTLEYENSHPFVMRDNFGRTWTLAHNGTIFDYPKLNDYIYEQEGRTDSERILYHIVEQMNEAQEEAGRALDAKERFQVLDAIVCDMAEHNKLNLLIYDGELMYAHTNYANSLYVCQMDGAAVFATVPLEAIGVHRFKPLPFTTLCAYQRGRRVFCGTTHNKEYKDNEEDMKYLFMDFSCL